MKPSFLICHDSLLLGNILPTPVIYSLDFGIGYWLSLDKTTINLGK